MVEKLTWDREKREDALLRRVCEREDWFESLEYGLEPRGALVRTKRLELVRDLLTLARQFASGHDERLELLARAQVHTSLASAG